jgi:hypothetical protein
MLFKNSFSVLCASCFNDNMQWRDSNLAKTVWCPGGFLYLNGQLFLKIWEIFCYYFVLYITYPFGLHLFSFFDAHDSQAWSFNGVPGFLCIPFTAFVSSKSSFVFFFNIYLSSSPKILSSTCSSLLVWLSPVFFI